jgi:hypothetical protein
MAQNMAAFDLTWHKVNQFVTQKHLGRIRAVAFSRSVRPHLGMGASLYKITGITLYVVLPVSVKCVSR